ncbi:hypothetical protein ACTFIV_003195, partial [Dictyostelium citrinum]
KDNQSSIFY